MIQWPTVYTKGFGQTLIFIVLYVGEMLIAAAKAFRHGAFTELRKRVHPDRRADF